MIQLRPTFSESWYRVASLRVRLRSSAQISRQYYRGERWYVVRDPAGNQFHRLSDPAYRFVGLLDGTRTVQEAWELVGGQLADDAPTQPEVIQILSQLYAANLIETNVTPDATVLLRRHKNMMKRRLQGRLMNILFPRIPLWDPDQFLKRWMPVARVLLSRFGTLLWIVLVLAAVVKLAPEWQKLTASAGNAIAPDNWIFLWGTFVLIKLIHELGHAFACRRFGGEVHELGIMFLVFIPTPYVDASTAWAFPSKWQRIFVGAAGMIVEIFFAAIMAFVWLNTNPDTLLNQIAYNAMLIASVSTILFNANPLLRYDGYYILSDYLEIPNLRQKSSEYTMGLIKRHVFRVKQRHPLPPPLQRLWLFLYAIASSIYRIFIGIMIILLVTWKVPILGVLMGIGGLVTWLVVPVVKTTKYLLLEPELHRKRGRAISFSVAMAAAVVILIGLIPFGTSIYTTGVLQPEQRAVLNTRTPGFVSDILALDGQMLEEGDVILVARNDELETHTRQLLARIRAMEAQLQQSSVYDQARRNTDLIQLAAMKDQLRDALRKQDELTIRSPIAGRLIAPNIEELMGRYLQRGQEVATVATTEQLIVRAALEQRDVELAMNEPDAPTEIRLAGALETTLPGAGNRVIPAAQKQLPHESLGHSGGGEIAIDPRDPSGKKPLVEQFELQVKLDNPASIYLPGQRAYVRLILNKRPLLEQWSRRFWQLVQTHSGSSRWL